MEYLNYAEDVKIDPNALDVEWLEQPELMRKYAKHSADTKRAMDEAKERFEIGRARIEMDIRSDPAAYGLSKATEASIQSTVLLQKEYQELSQEYQEARYENDVAIAVVRAVDQRKTALENLVRLLSASYFAGPQSPRDLYQENLENIKRKKENSKVKVPQRKKKGGAE